MKYIHQILTLSAVSALLYLSRSAVILHYAMFLPIASTYFHPLFTLISRTYRAQWNSSITYPQMFIAAAFAIFNMNVTLNGSTLRTWYGVGVALSIMASSYLLTRKEQTNG